MPFVITRDGVPYPLSLEPRGLVTRLAGLYWLAPGTTPSRYCGCESAETA